MILLPRSAKGSILGVTKDHSSRNPDFAHFLMEETDFKDTFQDRLQDNGMHITFRRESEKKLDQ